MKIPEFTVTLLFIHFYLLGNVQTITFMHDKKSYAMYKPWDASKEATIRFRFKTHNSYGLLFYVDDGNQQTKSGNFIQLMIDKGVLLLITQVSTEEIPTVKTEFKLGNNLNDGGWHYVEVVRNNRNTILRVDSLQRVVQLPGNQEKLKVNSNLFVGGTPKNYEQIIINKFLQYTPRFVGCIDRLFYSSVLQDVALPPKSGQMLSTQEVRQGCVNACRYQGGSCPNGGKCINLFNRVGCNCLGTGYEGINCTVPSKSVYLKGFDYITWKSVDPGDSTANRIELRFKTSIDSGILAIVGSPYSRFIIIELMNGKLLVHAKLDKVTLMLSLSGIEKLDNWNWHTVQVYRRESSLKVILDRRLQKNGTISTASKGFGIPNHSVQFGGYFNPSELKASKSKVHYIGCLQQIFCNGINVISEALHEQSKRVIVHGNVEPGCPLEPTEVPIITTKADNDVEPKLWINRGESTQNQQNGAANGKVSRVNFAKSKENSAPVQSARHGRKKKEMSQSTITGITAGTIVGAIAVIIAVACFINHLKKKYSGVFITSTMYTRGESFEHTPFNNGEAQLYISSPTGHPVKGSRV